MKKRIEKEIKKKGWEGGIRLRFMTFFPRFLSTERILQILDANHPEGEEYSRVSRYDAFVPLLVITIS